MNILLLAFEISALRTKSLEKAGHTVIKATDTPIALSSLAIPDYIDVIAMLDSLPDIETAIAAIRDIHRGKTIMVLTTDGRTAAELSEAVRSMIPIICAECSLEHNLDIINARLPKRMPALA